MIGQEKLDFAQNLLQKDFSEKIFSISRDIYKPVLHVIFKNRINFYIRYNDFGEYSYQIVFSQKSLDRIRYDNYDSQWKVNSKPNHVHLRFDDKGGKSEMNGIPSHDIPLLIQIIHDFSG